MPEKRGTSILFACAQYIFKTLVSFCFFCTWAGVFLYFSAMALISEFSSSEGSSGLALQLKTSSSIVLQDSHTSLLIILLTIKIQRYISSKLWINWDSIEYQSFIQCWHSTFECCGAFFVNVYSAILEKDAEKCWVSHQPRIRMYEFI